MEVSLGKARLGLVRPESAIFAGRRRSEAELEGEAATKNQRFARGGPHSRRRLGLARVLGFGFQSTRRAPSHPWTPFEEMFEELLRRGRQNLVEFVRPPFNESMQRANPHERFSSGVHAGFADELGHRLQIRNGTVAVERFLDNARC